MADMQKRKNVYAILFFLAILFIAIGLERNGGVEGLAIRQAAYAETWILPSCNKLNVQILAEDLGDNLKEYYGCIKPLSTYCDKAVKGNLLPKRLIVKASCPSLVDQNNLINLCIKYVTDLCNPSAKSYFFRSPFKR